MFHEGDPFGTQILTKSAFKAIKLVAFTNNHEIGFHASYKSLGKKLFNIYVGAVQISTCTYYTCALCNLLVCSNNMILYCRATPFFFGKCPKLHSGIWAKK